MSLTDAERLELHALCEACLEGQAGAAELARLQRWLAASEEARRLYVRSAALSASLFEYAGEMQTEEPERAPDYLFLNFDRRLWWGAGALAAAAALALGLWWSGGAGHPRREGAVASAAASAEPEETVARLSGAKDCQWAGGLAPEEFHRGEQVRLAAGVAEIAFDSGAIVTLEGPAELDLTSEWEAALRYGTLKARVPHEAIGFRVTNPEVEVVDLGTEFSVVAEESGGTEVFVTKGAVETRGSGGADEPVVLHETEARRFAHARTSEVRDREQKLRRLTRSVELKRTPQPLASLHWSFEGTPGVETAGLAGPARAAALEGPGLFAGGRFGQALTFDGRTYLRAELGALGPAGPRSAAFWLRLPADAQISEPATVLGWAGAGEGTPGLEIGWNREPAQGPLGAVRLEMGRGFLVGTTPLRDGQWHHLAVVLRAGKKEAKEPRLYVDGRLESVSARHGGLRRERHPSGGEPTLLAGGAAGAGTGFRGALDELYLANRALTPQEIRGLMERNRLSSEPNLADL